MAKIDPSLYINNYSAGTAQKETSALGKEEFLKILMAQLQNQDPLSPMEDKDFVAQMAQFSSLEQTANMTSIMEQLLQAQTASQMIGYQSFVGQNVVWHKITNETNEAGQPIVETGTGTVASLQFQEGKVQFALSDGTLLEPANISELTGSSASAAVPGGSSLAEASHLIGKAVAWEANGVEKQEAVQSVSLKDQKIWLQLKDGSKIEANQITKIEAQA